MQTLVFDFSKSWFCNKFLAKCSIAVDTFKHKSILIDNITDDNVDAINGFLKIKTKVNNPIIKINVM